MSKTILITGAGSGIGRALALRFSEDGSNVVGCDLPARLQGAAEACALAVPADVTDPRQLAVVVEKAVAQFGVVDALIANAGLARTAAIEHASWSEIESVISVNLFGVLHSVRAVLPVMRASGHGRIVSLVSRNAEFCPPELVGYNASKAAVVAMTRTLAHELKGVDILANNLIPGPSRTEMNPAGTLEPDTCHPTAQMLVSLPTGGPSGRTFYAGQDYPMFERFSSDGTAAIVHDNERTRSRRS